MDTQKLLEEFFAGQQDAMDVLAEKVGKALSEDAESFNEVVERVEQLTIANGLLMEQKRKDNEYMQKQNKVVDAGVEAGKERDRLEAEVKNLRAEVRDYKQNGAPKQRKQIANQAEANRKSQARTKQLEKELKECRKELADAKEALVRESMMTVYSEGGQHLRLLGNLKTAMRNGEIKEQPHLFALDDCGDGRLVLLDDSKELVVASAPKGGFKLNSKIAERARNVLIKVDRQGGKFGREDLGM